MVPGEMGNVGMWFRRAERSICQVLRSVYQYVPSYPLFRRGAIHFGILTACQTSHPRCPPFPLDSGPSPPRAQRKQHVHLRMQPGRQLPRRVPGGAHPRPRAEKGTTADACGTRAGPPPLRQAEKARQRRGNRLHTARRVHGGLTPNWCTSCIAQPSGAGKRAGAAARPRIAFVRPLFGWSGGA
eukprot:gene7687-biopygen7572